ncbi:MAG: heparan-alpha-glucosaminide N-acetyltransferase domain-containing protein, partial [Aurantibacter sp.]
MKQRIQSVDIFRGATIVLMILVNTPGTWSNVYAPLLHAKWHGYTPTDLVFPFFLFIVGTSIVFAYRNKPINAGTYKKISIRTLKLIGLGLFLG